MSFKKILLLLILSPLFMYLIFGLIKKLTYKAEYVYTMTGFVDKIKYEDVLYKKLDYVPDYYVVIEGENLLSCPKIYIENNNYIDFLAPFNYFVFLNSELDDFSNFIIEQPSDSSISQVYVKEDFVFPTFTQNVVEEVWVSQSPTDEYNIKDSAVVNHVVECVKSDGKLELDKDVYEHIKAGTWDNTSRFYLKYKGYPVIEKFYIEETEDGRYIVDRYTEAEYDTVYLDDLK